MDALLEQHPNWKLLSKTKLSQQAKRNGVSKKDFDTWYASNKPVTNELFARPRTNRKTQARIAKPPYSYQIDIVFMHHYKTANRGTAGFLLIVEVNSRKAWAYVLKDTKMPTIIEAYRKFLKSGAEQPWLIMGDDQFSAKAFRDVNDKLQVPTETNVAANEHITSGDPLGIIDSLVRTLRTLLEKRITQDDDPKWPKFLKDIVDTYNETPHSGLGKAGVPLSPDDAYDNFFIMSENWTRNADHNLQHDQRVDAKFKAGDYVRVRLPKGTFDKGTRQTMSLQVYRVTAVKAGRVSVETYPQGQAEDRAYKPNELLKVDKPQVDFHVKFVKAPAAVKATRSARKLAKEGIAAPAGPAARTGVTTRAQTKGMTTRSRAKASRG